MVTSLIVLTVYNLSHLICISHNPQVSAFLKPPMLGVVLQTYGSGNAPNNRDDLISEIKNATRRGVLIINCTQCLHGPVVDQYATGKVRVINVHWCTIHVLSFHLESSFVLFFLVCVFLVFFTCSRGLDFMEGERYTGVVV